MKDKIALVTGAGSGLGRALSLALVKKGYALILIDISRDTLEEAERSVKQFGGEALSLVVDISDVELVSQAIEKLNAEIPQIDLLINCAGFSITSTCDQLSPLDWQRIIGVNLLGTIQISTLVIRRMKAQGFGQIVNIASMFGLLPAPSGFIRTQFFENTKYIGVEKQTMLGKVPANLMSAEEAASRILTGIGRGKKMLVFPFYVRFLWWLDFIFPWLSEKIWLAEMRKYIKIT